MTAVGRPPQDATPPAHAERLGAITATGRRWAWLPEQGGWKYYALLGAIGALVLGPLGGIAAAYMNFSLGFFVGGQVLAGILGSTVTYGYGADGRHGANYIQTIAASVAGMSGMAVVIQAMTWMGLPEPPLWQLMLYMLCVGMFGVGVGMLYTPILVDRLQLTFPSGLAVANILRALTDPVLLRQSVSRLAGGTALGIVSGIGATHVERLAAIDLSASTFGAGMIVGARIGVAALVAGLAGWALIPFFVSIGWLAPGDPFRKITFLIALGMIMGAALLDVSLILVRVYRHARQLPAGIRREPTAAAGGGSLWRVAAWVLFWGLAVVAVGVGLLHQPAGYMVLAVLLVFVFAMVNGISVGMVDQNPISSAFVLSVILMAALGLRDPHVGLIAATVLLVSTSEACDMQQDRSTGWRLGTNRAVQFRFQVAGIVAGAVLAVLFARLFMRAYPELALDQTVLSASEQPHHWACAMTYKIVGALRGLTDDLPHQRTAVALGIGLGLATAALRLRVKSWPRYRRFVEAGKGGGMADFLLDAVLLPSPYASSFGGFVNLPTSAWFALGGIVASVLNRLRKQEDAPDALPGDMSTTSLVGGGLIAGDALAAVGLGIAGLLLTALG
ncbi:Oligopeptide transporter, OPT superfamily protein [Cupriavidus basilensis OR16]|uniref:Oligopeptide transporter, OPT superfamily protein n=1 Tax=Cupriavidus basilensis OR16 TaxID=1127483 RepID=H1RZ05_9BURK|nr:OPT/YSL family transporter [Cupriavidus basilensis]EHP44536.1 Oligopeptide transporter, OPT superfamily protein [Cupriavidus basilensis OR16]